MATLDPGVQPLSWKGAFFFTLAGLFLLSFQTTVQAWLDPWGYGPDLPVILVIYLGLTVPIAQGAPIAVLMGFFKDVSSGGVAGIFAGIFLTVFWVSGLLRRTINPNSPWYLVHFVFVIVLGAGVLSGLALYFLGRPLQLEAAIGWRHPVGIFLVSVLTTSIGAPLLFGILDLFRPRFDVWTERAP